MSPVASQPYVGSSAFAHKGGLHASAVAKVERSYQHVPPESVGNAKRVLVSELAGRSNVLYKARELGLDVELTQTQALQLLEQVKSRESVGFQYEGAEASIKLLVRRMMSGYRPPFDLVDFMTVVEKRPQTRQSDDDLSAQVMLKVQVGDEVMHTAAQGNGPVNALDHALRKALLGFYPSLERVRLVDYKVRAVDEDQGTGATVRVLLESTDGLHSRNTVGASHDIIEASWMALSNSLEYWLSRQDVAVTDPQ